MSSEQLSIFLLTANYSLLTGSLTFSVTSPLPKTVIQTRDNAAIFVYPTLQNLPNYLFNYTYALPKKILKTVARRLL